MRYYISIRTTNIHFKMDEYATHNYNESSQTQRLYTIRFHLYGLLEKAKLRKRKHKSGCQ